MSEKDDYDFLKALRDIPSYTFKDFREPDGVKDNRKRIKMISSLKYETLSSSGKIDALIQLGIPDNYQGIGRIEKRIISAHILGRMTLNEDAEILSTAARFLDRFKFKKLAQYVDNIVEGFKADPENVDVAGACGWITVPIAGGMFSLAAVCGVPLIAAAALTAGILATSFLIFLDEVAQDGKKAKLLEGTDNLSKPKGILIDRSSPS